MDDLAAARIVHAEASVLDYDGKVGVAQCIMDNDYNADAFTTPTEDFDGNDIDAVMSVFHGIARRFANAKLLQFRSFKKYSDGKYNPDWSKIYSGVCPMPFDHLYLGKDYISDEWGTFYFGRYTKLKKFKLLVIAGHGRNQNGSWDPGAVGCGVEEATITRELTGLVKKVCDLNALPCDVITDKNMYSYFKAGGAYDFTPYNYVLEIHFNASLTKNENIDDIVKGSMFFIDKTEKGHSVEDAILEGLYSLGSKQAWDGATITQKNYPNGLEVQNHVRAQGVSHGVLETCFVTDADDVAWYQKNKTAIAAKIVEGIIKGFHLADAPNFTYCGHGYATARALEDMNVRSGPMTSANKVGLCRAGEMVEVLQENQNGWLKVVWPGSPEGYAFISNVNHKYFAIGG